MESPQPYGQDCLSLDNSFDRSFLSPHLLHSHVGKPLYLHNCMLYPFICSQDEHCMCIFTYPLMLPSCLSLLYLVVVVIGISFHYASPEWTIYPCI